jgi:transposase
VLWGVKVRISALRLKTMELLILASQVELKEPIELYAKRWKIETLFQSLKGRGFNFEDTHITKTRRLKRMVAVLALAFAWSVKVGDWAVENIAPLKLKKHKRLEKSIFRYGLDTLTQVISNNKFDNLWDTFIQLMSSRNYTNAAPA